MLPTWTRFDWLPGRTREESKARVRACVEGKRREREEAATAGRQSGRPGAGRLPCLDYSPISQTRVPRGTSHVELQQRITIYKSGELRSDLVGMNWASKAPPVHYGARKSRGVSPGSARRMRRAVIRKSQVDSCQWVIITLTSQERRSDEDMGDALERFLAWGRKYLGRWFEFYVWAADLQQRGVLHYHLLLPYRIPKGMVRRMRELWAVKYEMGPGSFDIKPVRRAKAAARYIGKMAAYVSKQGTPECFRLGLSGDGTLEYEPWRKGRNGKGYERVTFRGRACDMSQQARAMSAARTVVQWPVGAFPVLGEFWGSVYFDSAEEAEGWLGDNLSP